MTRAGAVVLGEGAPRLKHDGEAARFRGMTQFLAQSARFGLWTPMQRNGGPHGVGAFRAWRGGRAGLR